MGMPMGLGGPPPMPGGPPGMPPTPGAGGTDPLTMLAMAMGTRPPTPGAGTQMGTGDKMAEVIQLLRRIMDEDPRVKPLAAGALQMLVQGPPPSSGAPPGSGPMLPPGGGPAGPAPGGMLMQGAMTSP